MAYFTSYAITRCRPGQSCQHLIEEINKEQKFKAGGAYKTAWFICFLP